MIVSIYAAKLVLCSGLLYAYYLLVLRNTRSHQYNRYFILVCSLLAIGLPIVSFKLDILAYDSNDSLVKALKAATIGGWEKEIIVTPGSTFSGVFFTAGNILVVIYLAGIILSLIPVLKSLIYIRGLRKLYKHDKIEGYRIYDTSEPAAPFSFFNTIFWNRNIAMATKEGQYMLRHEIFHIRGHHSADLAWLQCLGIIFWFNPFYHMMKREMQTIHEFLADEQTSAGTDAYDYAELLVLHAMQQKQVPVTHHFFQQQIKRRVTMITQIQSIRKGYFGRIMALPVLFIITCAFTLNVNQHSSTELFQKLQGRDTLSREQLARLDLSEISEFKMNREVIVAKMKNGNTFLMRTKDFEDYAGKIEKEQSSAQDPIFTKVEIEPEYPGGAAGWLAYLNKTFRYPAEAISKKMEGTVVVRFQIDKEGNVSDVQALKGPTGAGLKEEAMRVIKDSGKWIPAKQSGNIVKAYKIQPITFRLKPEP